jgi:hypothetical protein
LIILLVFSSMDLIIVHMVLNQKRERGFMSILWLRPMLLRHGVRFPYRHDLQLDGSTPVLRWVAVVVHIFSVVEHVQ